MADQSGAIYSTGGSLTRPDFSGKVCQTEVDASFCCFRASTSFCQLQGVALPLNPCIGFTVR
jgi:hypothetical protein